MMHYICKGGCHGEADIAKTCDTEGCAHFGQAMVACQCEDKKHDGAFDEPKADDVVVNNQ